MRIRLKVWLVLLCWLALPAYAEPPIPEAWREYVRLDQSYNFYRMGFVPVPSEKRAPVAIYHLDVPSYDADITDSDFIDEKTKQWAYVEKDGQKLVRFYFYDKSNAEMKRLAAHLKTEIQQQFWGVRLQSHNTHLVWDPITQDAAFIKMGTGTGDLWGRNVPSTIRINDYVERTMAARPGVAAAILPERHGVVIGGLREGQANLIRAAAPTRPPGGTDWELLPSHGLLNSPTLDEAAKAMGLTRDDYLKKHYAPKLAEHFAELHFKLGLYPEGHTQNTLLWFNRKTGAIEGFVHRDMTDMAIDPAIDLMRGGEHSLKLERANVSRLNRHHVGLQPEHLELDWAFGPAWIMSYVHEHFWQRDRGDDAPFIRAFILAYIDAAEKASGVKLDRSRLGEVETYPDQFGGRWIYEGIYKQVVAKWFPPVELGKAAKQKKSQEKLQELYLRQFELGSAAVLDPAFRLQLKKYKERERRPALLPDVAYLYEDQKVVVYDPRDGRRLSVAYGLDLDDRLPFEGLRFGVRCFLYWRLGIARPR